MGGGGDGRPAPASYVKRNFSIDKLAKLTSVKDDLTVLRHMWFGSKKGDDHASRLESFYGPQATACKWRLLARCCARRAAPACAPSARCPLTRFAMPATLVLRRRQLPLQVPVGPQAAAGSMRRALGGALQHDLGRPGRWHGGERAETPETQQHCGADAQHWQWRALAARCTQRGACGVCAPVPGVQCAVSCLFGW